MRQSLSDKNISNICFIFFGGDRSDLPLPHLPFPSTPTKQTNRGWESGSMLNSKHMRMRSSWSRGVLVDRLGVFGFQTDGTGKCQSSGFSGEICLESFSQMVKKCWTFGGKSQKIIWRSQLFFETPISSLKFCKTLHLQSSICYLLSGCLGKKHLPKRLP